MNSQEASISPSSAIVRNRFMVPSLHLSLQGRRRELRAHAVSSVTNGRSITFGALHAALDPVDRLDAGRRVDAFGGKILDVDQIDPLQVRIILGAAEGD